MKIIDEVLKKEDAAGEYSKHQLIDHMCPSNYGYMNIDDCPATGASLDTCSKCWNREAENN